MPERRLPLLVEPEALAEHLGAPGILVAFVGPAERFESAHVPGAVQLEYRALLRQEPPVGGLLPPPERLAEVLGAVGITPETHVVAYDDVGNGRAARLLWTLEALGHHEQSLLNGGLAAWRAAGEPLDSGPNPPQPARYPARLANPEALADRDYVRERLGDANTVILDARSPAEYRGEDVRAARGGHIPGAVNLEWTRHFDREGDFRLLPVETQREMLRAAGVTPDKEVIAHCQTHHRSALSYFVLRHLGYPRVRGYAGSWSEWGNDPALPVETGDANAAGE